MFKKLLLLSCIVTTVPMYSIDEVIKELDNKVDIIADNVLNLVGTVITQTDQKIIGLIDDIEDLCDTLIHLSQKEQQELGSLIKEYPELLNSKIEEKFNKFKQSKKWQNLVTQHDLVNRIKKLSEKVALLKLLWAAP